MMSFFDIDMFFAFGLVCLVVHLGFLLVVICFYLWAYLLRSVDDGLH